MSKRDSTPIRVDAFRVQFEVAAYKEQIPVGLVDERDTVDEVDAILMARWSAYSQEWMASDEFKAMMAVRS